MPIRLILAEDHALVRDGLQLLLSRQPDMQLLAETGQGIEVLDLIRTHHPDLLLLDLGLPGLDGLAIMAALQNEALSTRVLVVSARLDTTSIRSSLRLGAAGYLPKNENSAELLQAIRTVASGKRYTSEDIARAYNLSPTNTGDTLTAREQEILAHVGNGLTSKAIASRLSITEATVRKHRENICRKYGIRNAAEMAVLAVRLQLNI